MNIYDDEFSMWRALLAFSVCDQKLSMEEQRVLSEHIKKANMTAEQINILKSDLKTPQNIDYFFNKITDQKYKKTVLPNCPHHGVV